MIIGLTGYARAGKDSIANHLKKAYSFQKYVFSDVLTEILVKQGKEVTKENQSILGVKLRKESGCQFILAKLLSNKIKKNKNIVISGFRSPGEIAYFRKRFGSMFKLIYIKRYLEKRFNDRIDKSLTKEEFIKRDKRDGKKMGLDAIINNKLYDLSLENNNPFEQTEKKIDLLLTK